MLGGYGNRRIFLPTFIITTIDSILIMAALIDSLKCPKILILAAISFHTYVFSLPLQQSFTWYNVIA